MFPDIIEHKDQDIEQHVGTYRVALKLRISKHFYFLFYCKLSDNHNRQLHLHKLAVEHQKIWWLLIFKIKFKISLYLLPYYLGKKVPTGWSESNSYKFMEKSTC